MEVDEKVNKKRNLRILTNKHLQILDIFNPFGPTNPACANVMPIILYQTMRKSFSG